MKTTRRKREKIKRRQNIERRNKERYEKKRTKQKERNFCRSGERQIMNRNANDDNKDKSIE